MKTKLCDRVDNVTKCAFKLNVKELTNIKVRAGVCVCVCWLLLIAIPLTHTLVHSDLLCRCAIMKLFSNTNRGTKLKKFSANINSFQRQYFATNVFSCNRIWEREREKKRQNFFRSLLFLVGWLSTSCAVYMFFFSRFILFPFIIYFLLLSYHTSTYIATSMHMFI